VYSLKEESPRFIGGECQSIDIAATFKDLTVPRSICSSLCPACSSSRCRYCARFFVAGVSPLQEVHHKLIIPTKYPNYIMARVVEYCRWLKPLVSAFHPVLKNGATSLPAFFLCQIQEHWASNRSLQTTSYSNIDWAKVEASLSLSI
jgi:hypothetical protein